MLLLKIQDEKKPVRIPYRERQERLALRATNKSNKSKTLLLFVEALAKNHWQSQMIFRGKILVKTLYERL
jgi:hypothetical protein